MYRIVYYKNGDWLSKIGDNFSSFLENYLKDAMISDVTIRHFYNRHANWDTLYITGTTSDTTIADATKLVYVTIIDEACKRQPFTPDIIQIFYGLHFLKDFYKSRIKSNKQPINFANEVEF